jgi:NADH-quinone oxidoreductase subunit J
VRGAGGATLRGGVPVNWPMVAFVGLSGMVLYSAWRVATAPLITHAALFLASAFAGVAGLFFLLQADFLAAVQLLLYAGAVMTVVVFAIMLSELRDIDLGERRGLWGALTSRQFGWLPLLGAAALCAVLVVAYLRAALPAGPLPAPPDPTRLLAAALLGPYALPFEVASVLLVAAMLGAILLTRYEGGRRP